MRLNRLGAISIFLNEKGACYYKRAIGVSTEVFSDDFSKIQYFEKGTKEFEKLYKIMDKCFNVIRNNEKIKNNIEEIKNRRIKSKNDNNLYESFNY